MRHRFVLVLCALFVLVPIPAAAYATLGRVSIQDADIRMGVLGLTNEKWQHTSYVVTGASSSWFGTSMGVKTSGLPLSGFDDQHEVSITVYSSARHGETGCGYCLYPTFALALMRSQRQRLSVGLHSEPNAIDVITLSTAAPADSQVGLYVYGRDSKGATLTVAPNAYHILSVRWSGVQTWVRNDDSLCGKRPIYKNGIPVACDWPDLTYSTRGWMAYRWDARLDGTLVGSAWLDSKTGRVKLESNKRLSALASNGSVTYFSNVKLAPYSPLSSWQPWNSRVPTIIAVTRGLYRWHVGTAYTSLHATLPAR